MFLCAVSGDSPEGLATRPRTGDSPGDPATRPKTGDSPENLATRPKAGDSPEDLATRPVVQCPGKDRRVATSAPEVLEEQLVARLPPQRGTGGSRRQCCQRGL